MGQLLGPGFAIRISRYKILTVRTAQVLMTSGGLASVSELMHLSFRFSGGMGELGVSNNRGYRKMDGL